MRAGVRGPQRREVERARLGVHVGARARTRVRLVGARVVGAQRRPTPRGRLNAAGSGTTGAAPAPRARGGSYVTRFAAGAACGARARGTRRGGIGPGGEGVHAQPSLAWAATTAASVGTCCVTVRVPGHDDGEPARPARRLAQPRVARHGAHVVRALHGTNASERKRDSGQVHTTWVTESGMCPTRKPSHAPPLRSGGRGEAGSYPDVTEFLPAGRFLGSTHFFGHTQSPRWRRLLTRARVCGTFRSTTGSSRRRAVRSAGRVPRARARRPPR